MVFPLLIAIREWGIVPTGWALNQFPCAIVQNVCNSAMLPHIRLIPGLENNQNDLRKIKPVFY